MANVDAFNRGRAEGDDEFYTRLEDIENELRHYKDHFKGKTVFCNCDDPYESNFFKYFAMNFNYLGLKKLITTCYVTSPVMGTQLALFEDMQEPVNLPKNPNKKPYKVEITEVTDENSDGAFDLDDIKQLLKSKKNVCTVLDGDGDFRSEECVELLKQADIVVTNPPFSLFQSYIVQLMEYKKDFLVIGRETAVSYKEVFPLLRDNKVWTGYTHAKEFYRPDGTIKKFGNILWFTNLDISKRHETLIIYKHYDPNEYPSYENYNGIDVSNVANIPCDYYGNMGVPVNFMNSYNPDQFELVGYGKSKLGQSIGVTGIKPEHKKMMKNHAAAGDLYFIQKNGTPKTPFARIIIRRKDQPL